MKRHCLSSLEALEFSVFQDEHALRIFPNWMVRYFESLTEKEQWQYFLAYRKVADQMLSESYLIDQLKWILKYPSIELEYDLYVKARIDPDFYEEEVFLPEKWTELQEKYETRFQQAISLLEEQQREDQVSSQDEPEDTLPF
ncbi:hypothetical protein [Lentibacillus daqui]|nr:hypothetical protein [Lentibacillus daqui]